MTSDNPPEVEIPHMNTPTQASNVESESCPVCGEEFVHVTDAPVTIHKSEGEICLTSFGVVFFH